MNMMAKHTPNCMANTSPGTSIAGEITRGSNGTASGVGFQHTHQARNPAVHLIGSGSVGSYNPRHGSSNTGGQVSGGVRINL